MPSIQEQLVDSSRKLADLVVQYVGHSPERYGEAFQLTMKDIYPLSMRAGRVVMLCTERHPDLFRPYIHQSVIQLPTIQVDGVKRTLLQIFGSVHFQMDEDEMGQLFDCCLSFFENPSEAIAVRALALTVLYELSKKFPEVTDELIALVESYEGQVSRGLQGRCTIIKKQLERRKQKKNSSSV